MNKPTSMTAEATWPPLGWLTTLQAAARLGVSESQVSRYLKAGKLTGRRISWRWIITAESVENFRPNPVGNPNWLQRAREKEAGACRKAMPSSN